MSLGLIFFLCILTSLIFFFLFLSFLASLFFTPSGASFFVVLCWHPVDVRLSLLNSVSGDISVPDLSLQTVCLECLDLIYPTARRDSR